MTIPSIYFHHG
jgi:hypothetical protein